MFLPIISFSKFSLNYDSNSISSPKLCSLFSYPSPKVSSIMKP